MQGINERIDNLLSLGFKLCIWATALVLPLLFWNLTSEFYDAPKFTFLAAITGVMLIIWFLRFTVTGRLNLTRTPLDLPLFLLLIVFIVSTIFAVSRPVAILGNLPQIHGSLATYIVYILFYFALVSNLKQISTVKQTISLALFSGIILAVLGLLSYVGINPLFLSWTSGLNFTPTGASFTTAAILALLLPFPLMSVLYNQTHEPLAAAPGSAESGNLLSNIFGNKKGSSAFPLNKFFYSGIVTLFLITIVLIGSWVNYVAAAAAFGLVLFVAPPLSLRKSLYFLVVPVILTALVTFFSFVPVGGSKNLAYNQAQNFPREIQLPFEVSWKISVSAFRDSPFWGTGPASYLTDFTTYKPAEFNNTKIWNITFNTAFNEYFQFLATLGALGLIALLLLTTLFISFAFRALVSSQNSLGVSLAISGIIFFVLLALHTSTLTLWVMGLVILASFLATYKNITRETFVGSGLSKDSGATVNGLHFDIVPAFFLVIVAAAVCYGWYTGGRAVVADYHHRLALNAVAAGQGLTAYNELVAAENLNPYVDLYRTDMAQTNFALANAIATAKGPTQASPAGSLTDTDKSNIQTLLSQAINEGRVATALNPNNPADWEVLGSIYRQISGVAQNALTFSLDSYGRAISYDPLNPMLRLTVGGIYYSAQNYDMAVRFFTDAVNLKPDYANAYYNLAIAFKDKNDLTDAQASIQQAVSLLDPSSADYKTASDLLNNLKAEAATESAKATTPSAKTAPAAQTNSALNNEQSSSALQNQNLPKVVNLPQPENVATPAAVNKPGTTPTPTVAPTTQP